MSTHASHFRFVLMMSQLQLSRPINCFPDFGHHSFIMVIVLQSKDSCPIGTILPAELLTCVTAGCSRESLCTISHCLSMGVCNFRTQGWI